MTTTRYSPPKIGDAIRKNAYWFPTPERRAENDALILRALAEGVILVDFSRGIILRTRNSWNRPLAGGPVPYAKGRKNGYASVGFKYEGKIKNLLVHRIIWLAANGPIPEGLMMDHINRVRDDNRLCNLRLVDYKGNAANREYRRGADVKTSKLTPNEVLAIKERHQEGALPMTLAREFGVCHKSITNIVRGLTWKHI